MRPISVLVIIAALAVFALVVSYVRRWRLKEEYSILWLVLGSAMVLASFFPGVVDRIAFRLGVVQGTSLVFFVGLTIVALMLFQYAVEITRLSNQNKTLNQDLSILRARLRELEDATGPPGDGRGG